MYFQYPAGGYVTDTKTADANGNYSHSWQTSMNSPTGTYYYWAKDMATGYTTSKVSFTLTAGCIGPHWKMVSGKCLPSCGALAYKLGMSSGYECCMSGCKPGTSMGDVWDCTGCCYEPVGTNSCN